jgi:hypothetical protein
VRFDEEPPTAILGAAYREITKGSNKKVTVKALMAATRDKGIDRRQVEEFLAMQRRGEEHPRKYFDGL